jgi:WD40 repeat protein
MRCTIRFVLIVLIAFMAFLRNSVVGAQTASYYERLVLQANGELGSTTFNPDGKMIAAWDSSWEGQTRTIELVVWSSVNGSVIRRFMLHGQPDVIGYPKSLSWSPDSRYLAGVVGYAPYTGTLFIWDMNTGKRTTIANRTSSDELFSRQGGKVPILQARWNPKFMSILLIDADSKIRLIDFPSGKTRWELSMYNEKAGDPNPYYCNEGGCKIVWNSDGTRFLFSLMDAIYDGATGAQVVTSAVIYAHDSVAKWTTDGKYIFDMELGDGGPNDVLFVWDTTTGNLIDIPLKKVHEVAFDPNPDGERLAYCCEDGEIAIANWHTGKILALLPLQDSVHVHGGLIWSPDGKNLAVTETTNGSSHASIHIYTEAIEKIEF